MSSVLLSVVFCVLVSFAASERAAVGAYPELASDVRKIREITSISGLKPALNSLRSLQEADAVCPEDDPDCEEPGGGAAVDGSGLEDEEAGQSGADSADPGVPDPETPKTPNTNVNVSP